MTTLFCFGYGYTAQHHLASYGRPSDRVWVTVRDAGRAAEMNASLPAGITALAFDGTGVLPELHSAMAQAECLLVSVPPDASGDPVLRICADALARAAHPTRHDLGLRGSGCEHDACARAVHHIDAERHPFAAVELADREHRRR